MGEDTILYLNELAIAFMKVLLYLAGDESTNKRITVEDIEAANEEYPGKTITLRSRGSSISAGGRNSRDTGRRSMNQGRNTRSPSRNISRSPSRTSRSPSRRSHGETCAFIKEDGTKCKRMPQAGSDYCWQHQ
jgi:hypothetical protein